MFNQNKDEEKKLDWMYKGPTSTVSREEYLLGRPVDKTLEQINEEEKQKQQGLIPQPKNRVEHECIPPSIRDFNKLVQAEQVDLSTKLQEDPLVAIKKREEESRREFLQNPVQLKKLQKALKAQQAKKKKKKRKSKHSSDSESDLDKKLTEKLLGVKSKKVSKEERNLDIILMHKFEALKDKITESDLQNILSGKITDTDDSSDEEEPKNKPRKKPESSEDEGRARSHKNVRRDNFRRERSRERRDFSDISRRGGRNDRNQERSRDATHKRAYEEYKKDDRKYKKRSDSPLQKHTSESDSEVKTGHSRKYDSDDSDSSRNKKVNYGLVTSDGKKIPLLKKYGEDKPKPIKAPEPVQPVQKHRAKKLTEEEKEKLRREMMQNAAIRDKERAYNLKKHREKEEKERKEQNFDPEFIHKQLLKTTDISSVESRIKSNLNNIQRSSRDMDRNFSKR